METHSKLAVILHADVVGSTALVQKDERVAHDRIRDAFRHFSEVITRHGGTAHEVRGDALVAEFSKASDAVSAASAFQAAHAENLRGIADEIRPEVRVGIAMGEVVVADGTLTGEGVVLAQRIEQVASPGGICIQSAVYDTVPKRLPFCFTSLGERELKGFSEPVRVYAVVHQHDEERNAELEPQSASPSSGDFSEVPSIAVLPFTTIGDDPEKAYLGDGITSDLTTALSKISRLTVVARHSTVGDRGRSVDVREVGRELGVRYVLDGSVQHSGGRVRITTQLSDSVTGHQRWAERYDRQLDDVFAVQDEITRQVTVELQVQLTEGEQARVWSRGTNDVKAWELVVRASAMLGTHVREDARLAKDLALAATTNDRTFPAAWTVLGWALYQEMIHGWCESPEDTLAAALRAAQEALGIDPEHADSLTLLGHLQFAQGDILRSLDTSGRAVELAPRNAWILTLSASLLTFSGRPRDGSARIAHAMELSPVRPVWFLIVLGNCHLFNGEPARAVEAFRRATQQSGRSLYAHIGLVYALAATGKTDDARRARAQLMEVEPRFSITWLRTHYHYRHSPYFDALIEHLQRAGIAE